MDNDHWFGIGSLAVGDSVSPKTIAIESIQKQIYHQIKKNINNEFDISDTVLESICDRAISTRIDIIKTLTKEVENYTDGKKKYILLSLNKKIYSERLEKRLEKLNIEETLSRIEGPPGKENFLLLSEAIQMIVGFIDFIIKKELQSKNSNSKIINKVKYILNDYNDRDLGLKQLIVGKKIQQHIYFPPNQLRVLPWSWETSRTSNARGGETPRRHWPRHPRHTG